MTTSYRGYQITVETVANPLIVYDIQRGRNWLLAGFSYTDINEDVVLDRMKQAVDDIIADLIATKTTWSKRSETNDL